MLERYAKRAQTQISTRASQDQQQALNYQHQMERQALSTTQTALNQVVDGVSRIAGGVAQYNAKQQAVEDKKMIEQGMQDGELSVSFGQYQADLKDGDDPYSKAFNEAAQAKIFSNIKITTDNRIAEIAAEFADDPTEFRARMSALGDAVVEELELGEKGRLVVSRTLDEGYARYAPQVVKNGYQKAKKEEVAAYNNVLDHTINTSLTDIRNGNYDRLESLYEDFSVIYDEGVERGHYSEADKAKVFKGVLLEANEQQVMSYVDAATTTKDFAGGMATIDAWRDSTEQTGQFSPDQLDLIEDKAKADLKREEFAYKSQLKEQKKALEKANKLEGQINAVNYSIDNNIAMPKTTDNQKAIDVYFANMPTQFNIQDPQHRQSLSQIVSRTKLIPTQVIETLDRASLSNNTDSIAGAAEMYAQLKELSPRTLINSTNPDTAAYYEGYARLVRAGLTPEEAQEQSFANVYKQDDAQTQVLKSRMERKDYQEERHNFAQSAIDDRVTGWFSSMGDLSELGAAGIEYEADYNTLFDANYQKTGGDLEAAQSLTDMQIQRKWSATDINGDWQPMRYSPESLYGGDGDNSWISEQWQDIDMPVIKETLGLGEDAELILQPHTMTGRGLPTWKVLQVIRDEDGALNELRDVQVDGVSQTWYPDWKTYADKMGISDKAEKRLERAKREWEANQVMDRQGASIPKSYGYFPAAEQKFSTKHIRGW
ncbi:lytic transglycosylase [Vibrio phage CKB-S2]|nr:lytic transglycosylase [Vibrio phage CKB-S2]